LSCESINIIDAPRCPELIDEEPKVLSKDIVFDFRPKPYLGVETARHRNFVIIREANVKNPRVSNGGGN
jgi:hypothetical protein